MTGPATLIKPLLNPRTAGVCLGAALLAALLAGCRHKELSDGIEPAVKVNVAFDWKFSPDANPGGMCVFFYNKDNGEARRFDFPGTKGGQITLPPGDWHVMSYNNDTEGIIFGGHDGYRSHTATTRQASILEPVLGNYAAPTTPRAEGTDGETVSLTPDMLWGDAFEEHNIPGNVKTHTVTVTPRELVCHYSYEIRNVENLGHVTDMCAAISGMAGTLTLHSEELHETLHTLPIPAEKGGAATITGEFLTFGHHESNAAPHLMTLYVWTDDGRKWVFGSTHSEKFDVSDQVDNAPDKRHVHIVIDGLDIPVEINSLFTPATDDWFGEEYQLGIN